MKVKAYKNLYKWILIEINVLFFLLISLTYFIGFEYTSIRLMIYFIILIGVLTLSISLYLICTFLSKTFLVFTKDEIQLVSKKKSKVLVKVNSVIDTKYIRVFDITNFSYNFCPYVKLAIKSDKDEIRNIVLFISKDNYLNLSKERLI